MKRIDNRVWVLPIFVVSVVAMGESVAKAACSPTQAITSEGGPLDTLTDSGADIYFLYWGYGTYGDPNDFASDSQSVLSNVVDSSFGMGGTRWFGVPTQYSGADFEYPTLTLPIANPAGVLAGTFSDESNLPPKVNGTISLTTAQVMAEVDRAYLANGLSGLDDIIEVMLPVPAGAPDNASACGAHFVTPGGHLGTWIGYPDSIICSSGLLEMSIVHEAMETMTDPIPGSGLTQGGSTSCEMGDICVPQTFQVQLNPTGYPVDTQTFLSNEAVAAGANGCVYGRQTQAAVFGLDDRNQLNITSIDAETASVVNVGQLLGWGAPSGATLTGSPGAASWGPGRLDAFVRDTAGTMHHASSDDGGYTVAWETLSSSTKFTQSPDAVSWGAGDIQVFGIQGKVMVKDTHDWGGSWSGWKTVKGPSSGAYPVSKVTVASWGASNVNASDMPYSQQTIVAAFRGSDGKVWLGYSTFGGAFTWSSVNAPATLAGDLDISASAPPRLDLFVLDTSGNLWDMASLNGTTIATSTKWAHPSQGSFQLGAGVAGLGDGRFLVGARVGGNGSDAFLRFQDWNHDSGWFGAAGAYNSGVDIVSW